MATKLLSFQCQVNTQLSIQHQEGMILKTEWKKALSIQMQLYSQMNPKRIEVGRMKVSLRSAMLMPNH